MSQSSENSSTDMILTRLGLGAEFPVGLRVMAIDPDFASLGFLNGLLIQCNFTVLHETSARSALERVYVRNEECDIVVTELDNLDVDAFGFLDRMRRRVPIVVLSNLDDKRMITKAILTGVSDYMLKPATFEMMRNIWQHVLRSRLSSNSSGIQFTTNLSDIPSGRNPNSNTNNPPNSSPNPNPNSSPTKLLLLEGGTSEKQQIDSMDKICQHMTENTNTENKVDCELIDNGGNCIDNDGDSNSIKKTRISWHDDLHQRFITAVDQLCGPDVAKPKQILELMNVPGLSRENVASHLQKYRLALKNQLKVQPIWMDSNNNEATTSYNNGVENYTQMGLPFLHSAEATGQLYSQYHDYNYSSSSSPPIIEFEPQYDTAMFNISNHLFNHTSQANFHGLAPQQPPMAPGGNFSNTMRVINGVNFPAAPRYNYLSISTIEKDDHIIVLQGGKTPKIADPIAI